MSCAEKVSKIERDSVRHVEQRMDTQVNELQKEPFDLVGASAGRRLIRDFVAFASKKP